MQHCSFITIKNFMETTCEDYVLPAIQAKSKSISQPGQKVSNDESRTLNMIRILFGSLFRFHRPYFYINQMPDIWSSISPAPAPFDKHLRPAAGLRVRGLPKKVSGNHRHRRA